MLPRVLLKDILSARNQRFLANSLFQYLDELVEPESIGVFAERSSESGQKFLFKRGIPTTIASYPETFWAWVSQFDTSDGLIPLAMNTCQWEYTEIMDKDSYVFMLDNHPEMRTYLIIEGLKVERLNELNQTLHLDSLQVIASRWQCVRAETEAAKEFKQRDIKEAKYLDVIKQRELFIDNMKLVQEVAVEISNPANLDELYRLAVEVIRDKLGFDRAVFMLLDIKKRCFSGTYGTDEEGKTVSEHHTQYDLHQLEETYIDALLEGKENLVIVEEAPLYTAGSVVGQGWNGMLILRDGDETIGWIAMDNYINRTPITSYQRQMLESFGSLLSQIYIRKRQEQNVRMLHASMVELSRCMTVSEVCKSAVTFAINRLGIDRFAVFLTDKDCTHMQGTWGTDIRGNIVDESYYRSETVDRSIVKAAQTNPNEVVFEESVPIYHDFHIVGFGWTAMTMLVNNSGEPIAFIAADNLIKRSPLTHQLREVIRMFSSNLTEVLLRTRAQEAIHELNDNLEREVKARTRELQKANEQLERMAKLDPLTRLGNRRMLESLLEEICFECCDKPNYYGLILVDIDHFGLYNNQYGHMQGDIALMRIGSILQSYAQSEREVFCRIGGEEFALLVSSHEPEKVHRLSESIRDRIEQENIAHEQSTVHKSLTVSIGYSVMELNQSEFSFDKLYHSADRSLYEAKNKGRNQVAGTVSTLESIS
ncbi:GGDEF domain-containing protein [Vibrio tubiashii]|uniref:diguanylate cyclase n=1 Tax=Vibrio tubiashii ATCC 19109 TaxID=1051646 RepID=F9T6H9_9VIBR|nr:GGDEF domain-containing protein [Vibrio tubiashii]AIW16668.1 diguanylate cyclase [Vibrio tubiashii ATCC 19109]EGU54642.1 two-component response regulator [Vibrio tubiashii ATCC 19109]EIF02335.1 two-component response regulator [Vibrio tubiashii NCIMB 1337 = ATCC 19106]